MRTQLSIAYEESEVLHKLRQFFIYEVCEETINEDGEFRCDTFCHRSKMEAYIIKDQESNQIMGYILMTKNTFNEEADWHITELLILPKDRRKGYGKEAISKLVDIHKKEIFELLPSNSESRCFWESITSQYNNKKESEFILFNI